MTRANYYDPMFYICSEKMPFTIRIKTELDREIDGDALEAATQKAVTRYPYFAVKVIEADGEWLAVPNEQPIRVYRGRKVLPLGGEEVNRHLTAVSYYDSVICFFTSHVITDGCGFFPFIKTVLYYYLCSVCGNELDSANIRLVDEPFYEDELGNPFPEEKMRAAVPFYVRKQREFFRLTDGGLVNDSESTVYRFRVNEAEMMQFNHDNDGSPCALVSSLMTKAIWELHPKEKRDIVSAVSFNLRPGLGNINSYRMLCSAIMLGYPESLRGAEAAKLCTCSRGMVSLQSQPENVLYCAEQRRIRMEKLLSIRGVEEKRRILGAEALRDSVENTFSVSYVGKVGLAALEPHIKSMYNLTDGSTYQTVFIEISAINGWFDIAFIQGFSSDVYYRAFLRQLALNGLGYIEEGSEPLDTPRMELP